MFMNMQQENKQRKKIKSNQQDATKYSMEFSVD